MQTSSQQSIRCSFMLSMKVNTQKTKLLTEGFLSAEKWLIVLDWESLEAVDDFKYQGSVVTMMGQGEDMNSDISNTQLIFCCLLLTVVETRCIKLITKICIYQALIWSILLYNCKTWPCWLKVFDLHCLHHILHIHREQYISNFAINAWWKISTHSQVLLRRLSWCDTIDGGTGT